jgi:hypothetical protein
MEKKYFVLTKSQTCSKEFELLFNYFKECSRFKSLFIELVYPFSFSLYEVNNLWGHWISRNLNKKKKNFHVLPKTKDAEEDKNEFYEHLRLKLKDRTEKKENIFSLYAQLVEKIEELNTKFDEKISTFIATDPNDEFLSEFSKNFELEKVAKATINYHLKEKY